MIPMGAGEIVELLPRLSPALSKTLLRFLQEECFDWQEGIVKLSGYNYQQKRLFKCVKASQRRTLQALLGSSSLGGGAVEQEGGGSGVVLKQLAFCLLFALAPSLPDARQISIVPADPVPGNGNFEQAVEVLCSALVSQHWSNGVRRLSITGNGAFPSDRESEHLAHLLESEHCKLQRLSALSQAMGDGGVRHIARALQTNHSLTALEIHDCPLVGDDGVEQLAAMLRTNSTLRQLKLIGIGMTAQGLRHLCDGLQTQQSRHPATSSSSLASETVGGLILLDISNNEIGEGGARLLGAMLANNRCLKLLDASSCSLVEEDGEGHLAEGMRENSTLEVLNISNNPQLSKVALGLLVRCLAINNNTALKTLAMNYMGEVPAAEELAHMLISNESLTKLYFEHASYDPEDWPTVILPSEHASYDAEEWATVILPALGHNKTLLYLDLMHCPGVGGEQVRAALFDLLRINTTIQEIRLSGTQLYQAGEAEAVEVELRRNKQFRHALSSLPQAKPKSCRIILCGHAYAGKTSLLQTMKRLQVSVDRSSVSAGSWCCLELLLSGVVGSCCELLSGGSSQNNCNNNKDMELSKRTRGIDIQLVKNEPDLRISAWDLAGQREFHALHDFVFPTGNNAATLFVLTLSPLVSPAGGLRAGDLKRNREFEQELHYWLQFIVSNFRPGAAPSVVVVITHKDTLAQLTHMPSWLLSAREIVDRLASKFSGLVSVERQPIVVDVLRDDDGELTRWVPEAYDMLRKTLESLEEEPAICDQVLKIVQDASQTGSKSPIISRAEFTNICRPLAPAQEIELKDKEFKEKELKEKKRKEKMLKQVCEFVPSESEVREIFELMKEVESESEEVDVESESEETNDETQILETTMEELKERKLRLKEAANIERESESEEADLESESEKADDETRTHETAVDKLGRAVAAYLHNAGEVIYHDNLDLIISNPRWFCQGVLGQLIDPFPWESSQGQKNLQPERPKNGLVSKTFLSGLLQEAVKCVPGLDPKVVTPDQLIQLMLLLNLCYEQTRGDPNTAYFLPAIFEDKGNKAADGERPLTWRELATYTTFVGRRLQCGDLERTFLTDGFFPRLQVVLHNYAFEAKWVENTYSSNYMLEKNLFSILVNGMEILIEFSGSTGYFVDILVKSSKSHQQTMEFLRPNIIGTIRTFCASQEGCQGVTLAEAIIRPECLYSADGGNPILCTHRRDQSVLVEELTQRMRSMPDWQHCWEKVEDSDGGLVLPHGQHSVMVLLDVPLGREPNLDFAEKKTKNEERELDSVVVESEDDTEEFCYPDNNPKYGKSRGLALILSMEKTRPGAGVDRGRLETLFLACGFTEVQHHVDLKAFELVDKIQSVAKEGIVEEDECFVCSINAHGGTTDGKPYIVDENGEKIMVIRDIIEPFRHSKHLLGKPKVFFVNCCRTNSYSVEDDDDYQQGTGSLCPPLLELSDCLLVFSTSEGCRSGRYANKGTIFVHKLVETVMMKRQTMDVLGMMTEVNRRVMGVQNEVKDPATGTTSIFRQCCEKRDTFQRKLYWKDSKRIRSGTSTISV